MQILNETKQNKKVWVIHQEGTTAKSGYGGRTFYLAKELARLGHEVSYVLSPNTHMHKSKPSVEEDFSTEQYQGINLVYVKTLPYENASNYKRVLGWFQFCIKSLRLKSKIGHSPDVVIVSSPSLISAVSGLLLKRLTKCQLIFDVRDLWPLTLTELGGVSENHPLIKLMKFIEKKLYSESNHIVSNLPNAYEYFQQFGIEKNKFSWITNGIDVSEFSTILPLPDKLENELKSFCAGKFVIGYTGSIGRANNLQYLIQAADKLQHDKSIAFVLIGRGEELETLKSYVKENEIANVLFLGAVEKELIPSLHRYFSVGYIGWGKHSLYQFGTAPNKITEYMYSKVPVLNSFSGKGDYVQLHNCGVTVPAEDVDALVDKIKYLVTLPNETLNEFGANGKAAVIGNYTYEKLSLNYEALLK